MDFFFLFSLLFLSQASKVGSLPKVTMQVAGSVWDVDLLLKSQGMFHAEGWLCSQFMPLTHDGFHCCWPSKQIGLILACPADTILKSATSLRNSLEVFVVWFGTDIPLTEGSSWAISLRKATSKRGLS